MSNHQMTILKTGERVHQWSVHWMWHDGKMTSVEPPFLDSLSPEAEVMIIDFEMVMPPSYSARPYPGSMTVKKWPDEVIGKYETKEGEDFWARILRDIGLKVMYLERGRFDWDGIREMLV